MARRVYFSFHYERDIWRVNQVRNSQVVTSQYEQPKFVDKAEWEAIQRRTDRAIKSWIDDQMYGTSVIVVLIGAETYSREYVMYEIAQAYINGKGLLGIYIHNIKNSKGEVDERGENPFDYMYLYDGYSKCKMSEEIDILCYDWSKNNGRDNIGAWIEEAALNAGR